MCTQGGSPGSVCCLCSQCCTDPPVWQCLCSACHSLSLPSHTSVTLSEATAPVKLPIYHCPWIPLKKEFNERHSSPCLLACLPALCACVWLSTPLSHVLPPADVQPDLPEGADPSAARNATHAAVLLWYTHSHFAVGTGQATCSGDCTCEKQSLEPHIRGLFGTQVWRSRPVQWLLLLRALPLPGEPAGHVLLWTASLSWLCRQLGMLTSPGLFQSRSPATLPLRTRYLAHWPSLLCPSPAPIWQDHLHLFMVTRSRNCFLTVQTLPNTTTGGCVQLLVLPRRFVRGAPGPSLPCALLHEPRRPLSGKPVTERPRAAADPVRARTPAAAWCPATGLIPCRCYWKSLWTRSKTNTSASPSPRRHLFRVKGVLVSSAAAVAGRVPEELHWGEDLQHMPPPPPSNFNDGQGP